MNKPIQMEQLTSRKLYRGDPKTLDVPLFVLGNLLEDKGNEKAIVAQINALLKTPNIDEEMYVFISKVITTISSDALFDNITSWTVQIANQGKNSGNNKRYMVLSTLIELGNDHQEFKKLMTNSLLVEIVKECLSQDLGSCNIYGALKCLATSMELYSKTCIVKKHQIESYLLQFLTSHVNVRFIKEAALCFLKLQRVGPSGANMANYINNWSATFGKLCVTLDDTYDVFLADIEEFHKYNRLPINPYQLPELPKCTTPNEMLYSLENRLHNICLFLRGMLDNEFVCVKSLSPQYILNVITRALSLHKCATNASDSSFSIALLKNQITILYLLRSLVTTLKLNLLRFSAAITKLLLDCLERTRKCKCFNHTAEYKVALYNTFEYWIEVLKNTLHSTAHDKIINLIVDDISCPTNEVSLTITNKSGKNKKAKNKDIEAKIISSSKKSSDNRLQSSFQVKERVCYQSLCFLVTFLKNTEISVKDNIFLELYRAVIHGFLSNRNGKAVFPYDSERIDSKLSEVLIAMLECSIQLPPMSFVVNFLRPEQRFPRDKLILLEKICQPILASWSFDVMQQHHQHSASEKELQENYVSIISSDMLNEAIEAENSETVDDNNEDEDLTPVNLEDVSEAETEIQEVDTINDKIELTETEIQEVYNNGDAYEDISSVGVKIEEEMNGTDEDQIEDVPDEDAIGDVPDDRFPHDYTNLQVCNDDEPVCKKTKIAPCAPDIEQMLASFADVVDT